MRFLVVAGNTETAGIDGISAAGADPELMRHTPAADLDILTYGEPVRAPVVPVSPSGCPTPAVVTRAAQELTGVETLAVDAGLAQPSGAPTVVVGDGPAGDVREETPVPNASEIYEAARRLGRSLPDDRIVVGETIPGGTTTALGVLTALGERATVSSSLPENPLSLKRSVVEEALQASDISSGDTAGDPLAAIRRAGDPVLAGVAGVVGGALDAGTAVTLAGGTQLAAAGALVRHAGVDGDLTLATTSFVADDPTAGIADLATDLDLNLRVTDPGFAGGDHPAMRAYEAGEAKEGVGMGGALALVADDPAVSMADLRAQIRAVYDRVLATEAPPLS